VVENLRFHRSDGTGGIKRRSNMRDCSSGDYDEFYDEYCVWPEESKEIIFEGKIYIVGKYRLDKDIVIRYNGECRIIRNEEVVCVSLD